MPEKETIEILVRGGKASPGPATAPRLSAYKLNVGEVFKQVNEKTKGYAGMQVPVKIIIDKKTKEFSIEVGIPPVSSLIKKELGIEKAAVAIEKKEAPKEGEVKEEKKAERVILGDLKMEQILKIAKMKQDALLARDLKSAAKMIVGTVCSMPLTIENKRPKEILEEIKMGKWDQLFR